MPRQYRVSITSVGGHYTTGLIEPGGYRFSALIFDVPSQWGLQQGRISKLRITDKTGNEIAAYDRGFALDAKGKPERHDATQLGLINALLQTFPVIPGREPAAREKGDPKGPVRKGGSVQEKTGTRLDQHTPAEGDFSRPPPPAKPKHIAPPVRERFAGFSCYMPPGCPDPAAFRTVTLKLATERFGGEAGAAAALQAYERCLTVPEEFEGNPEAADHYREARIAVSKDARAWQEFQELHYEAFRSYDEDGHDIEPAIPGWDDAHRVRFQSDEGERTEAFTQAREAIDRRAGDRGPDEGREIDPD